MKIDPTSRMGTSTPVVAPVDPAAARSPDRGQVQADVAAIVGKGTESVAPVSHALPALVERLNVAARVLRTNLHFLIQEETNQLVVRVVDSATGQVIRSIPPDQVVTAHDTMLTLVGLLLDTKI